MDSKKGSPSVQDVNVHVIERDLRNLWEQMAETIQVQGQEPVMRACVLNLIVCTPGEHTAGEVNQIMAEVTTQHPSRIFVILPKYDAPEPVVSAWVTAQCHLAPDGRKQVCCEQIMITAEGEGVGQLPSIVRSLLVPDLPVVLWWRDVPSFESRVFDELAKTSDRVIIDSHWWPNPEEGLAEVAALMSHRGRWTALTDLSWSRLTPWRISVAGFFDVPDWRGYLNRVNRVEIEYTEDHSDRRSIPSEAFFLACWLASRMKWQPASKPQRGGDGADEFTVTSETLRIAIRIQSAPPTSGGHIGLSRLRLITESEPSARFVVSCSDDGLYLRTNVELAGTKLTEKVIPQGDQSEVQLISRELEILGRDTIYEDALAFFVGLRGLTAPEVKKDDPGR